MSVTTHRVAVVVIADVPGVHDRDATDRLVAAVAGRLGTQLPTPTGRGPRPPAITIASVLSLSAAARGGDLTVQLRRNGRPR